VLLATTLFAVVTDYVTYSTSLRVFKQSSCSALPGALLWPTPPDTASQLTDADRMLTTVLRRQRFSQNPATRPIIGVTFPLPDYEVQYPSAPARRPGARAQVTRGTAQGTASRGKGGLSSERSGAPHRQQLKSFRFM
jgi:hypothetical protein